MFKDLPGEREGDVNTTRATPRTPLPTGGNDDELAAAGRVSRRCRVPGRGHGRFPQQRAGGLVEGTELPVFDRRADEDETAGGHDRSAVVFAAGVLQSARGQRRILAKRNLPGVLAGVQVDRAQCSTRRGDRRVTIGVQPAMVRVFWNSTQNTIT